MEGWKTIIAFTYPHEAHLAKSKLESEGIDVILKDELTSQVNNFYSNAIGGVKLNIKETDFELAKQILIEGGFLNETSHQPNKFITLFDNYSSKIPFIGNKILELRLLVVVAIISLSLFLILEYLSRPSTYDLLTKNNWCVEKVYSNGTEIKIIPSDLRLETPFYSCEETMDFRENGIVIFPKINTYENWLQWVIEDDSLFVIPTSKNEIPLFGDSLSTIENETELGYMGSYKIEINGNTILLRSDDLVIKGTTGGHNF